jgi:hypothetical protein
MRQYVKTFWDKLGVVEMNLNDFLTEHPDYEISKITMTEDDRDYVKVLAVFKINPTAQTYAVARGVTE